MSEHEYPRGNAEWLRGSLGHYLLAREYAYYDNAVTDVFGYNAFQLGLSEIDFLRASRIVLRCRVDANGTAGLRADFRDLPIASNSVDLILLPHVLEFSANPHQILREVVRVLVPEGQVVISCFNPWSLWGVRRLFTRNGRYPWNGRFLNLPRLKDWLTLLGLEITAGQMSCYAPPFINQKWLERFAFMEAAGDRWWPIAGGIYFLQAIKRVRGVRIITPARSERAAPRKKLVAVPKKVRQPEDAVVARNGVTSDQ
ncbi:MAG: class I SAM-dependent methyltransferase [Gammaproteobacteria bacterium]|nr:class I SAM-dependent methyltransferase [Gammaproteobacteria bacterium]